MNILGIESSCDETAAAIVQDGRTVLSSVIQSSAEIHARYGGVVPEIAAREHTMAIVPVVQDALREAGLDRKDLDGIAVTQGPGLLGSLLVGMTFAKALSHSWQLPLIGVHHLAAHLYANALVKPLDFPALALLVSGGHTAIFYWTGHGALRLIGETRDDAAGEAFDKGARLLGL
ncbi:MAG: tRNA (adenosine(37)-N6)-threonylcarbamoyltransferase complex transferase subunit TsaD, partial [Firmicutes bacterium]|nr:tRNA (adenosine(37)-N6)-threonylcarbamoyltransferase complex transferase subunit TsaD [Bacillota bacterium]